MRRVIVHFVEWVLDVSFIRPARFRFICLALCCSKMSCLGLLSTVTGPKVAAQVSVSLTDCRGYLVRLTVDKDDTKADAKLAEIGLGSLVDAVASIWNGVEGVKPGRFRDPQSPQSIAIVFANGGKAETEYVPKVPYVPFTGKVSEQIAWSSASLSNEFAQWMRTALCDMSKSQSGVLSFTACQ